MFAYHYHALFRQAAYMSAQLDTCSQANMELCEVAVVQYFYTRQAYFQKLQVTVASGITKYNKCTVDLLAHSPSGGLCTLH
jgi:ABC-type transporter lipoprotein component MlaA